MANDQNEPKKHKGGKTSKDSLVRSLFINLKEISREDFTGKYGRHQLLANPVVAVAERIGEVTINTAIFKPGLLKTGNRLSLPVFDEKKYYASIDNIAGGAVLSVRAHLEEPGFGMLILSFADDKVLATLELAAKNILYTVNYDHISVKHYLFEAPLDKIERLEDGLSLIPPNREGK